MRCVFLGSSDFSVVSLDAMVEGGFPPDLVVVPQPRPSGRGLRKMPSPVATVATGRALPCRALEDVSAPGSIEALRAARPDVGVVVAFGQILRREVLALPPRGWINVHASLLPRHRGASPIARAILDGDAKTGVTIIRLVRRMDAGPVIARRETPIEPGETAGDLSRRLAILGGKLLVDTLRAWRDGRVIEEIPQDEARATYCGKIEKSHGAIRWELPAEAIERHVRAMTPWPGAWSLLDDPKRGVRRWIVLGVRTHAEGFAARAARAGSKEPAGARVGMDAGGDPPGRIQADPAAGRLFVRAGRGAVEVLRLRVEGGREMDAAAFLRGARLPPLATLHGPKGSLPPAGEEPLPPSPPVPPAGKKSPRGEGSPR